MYIEVQLPDWGKPWLLLYDLLMMSGHCTQNCLMWDAFHTPLARSVNTILSEFTSALITMCSHSPKVRLIWKEQTGRAMGSYSATRWWSRWEIMKQLMVQYPEIEKFLTCNPQLAPASHAKLIACFKTSRRMSIFSLN